MNHQTAGPLTLSRGELTSDNPGTLVAEAHGPTSAHRMEERAANRRLLAASYNAFDTAGRALGVDAAELAEALDLAKLIRIARAVVTSSRVPDCPELDSLARLINKLPSAFPLE